MHYVGSIALHRYLHRTCFNFKDEKLSPLCRSLWNFITLLKFLKIHGLETLCNQLHSGFLPNGSSEAI